MRTALFQSGIFFCVMVSVTLFVLATWKVLQTPFGKYEERYLKVASGKLDRMYVFLPPEMILYLKFLASVCGLLLGFFLFSGVKFPIVCYMMALSGGFVGFRLPEWILTFMEQRRLDLFELQLLEALTSIANSLKAGFSFPQALDLLVKEGEPPISQEFSMVLKENRLGLSLEEALINVTKRVASDDLFLVVSSVVLTRELGGNLANIFERLAGTIRERLKLKGKIQALTSQGRMQGWVVGLMPLVLGLVIHFISPGMMEAFFDSLVGWFFVGLILVMEGIGGLVIKKIVTIDP